MPANQRITATDASPPELNKRSGGTRRVGSVHAHPTRGEHEVVHLIEIHRLNESQHCKLGAWVCLEVVAGAQTAYRRRAKSRVDLPDRDGQLRHGLQFRERVARAHDQRVHGRVGVCRTWVVRRRLAGFNLHVHVDGAAGLEAEPVHHEPFVGGHVGALREDRRVAGERPCFSCRAQWQRRHSQSDHADQHSQTHRALLAATATATAVTHKRSAAQAGEERGNESSGPGCVT